MMLRSTQQIIEVRDEKRKKFTGTEH